MSHRKNGQAAIHIGRGGVATLSNEARNLLDSRFVAVIFDGAALCLKPIDIEGILNIVHLITPEIGAPRLSLCMAMRDHPELLAEGQRYSVRWDEARGLVVGPLAEEAIA